MRGGPILALFVLVSPAHARHLQACGPAPPIEVSVEIGAAQVGLGGRLFRGSGQPAHSDGGSAPAANPVTLSVNGSLFTPDDPVVLDFRLHAAYVLPYHVTIGGVLGGIQADAVRPRLVGNGWPVGSTLSGLIVGGELGTAWRIQRLLVRGGMLVGYRSVELPLTGFVSHSCGRGGRCYPSLRSDEVLAEPRLALAIVLAGRFELGGYAGADLAPGGGWAAGAFLGAHTGAWDTRAAVRP
jgi:hypothetical protein